MLIFPTPTDPFHIGSWGWWLAQEHVSHALETRLFPRSSVLHTKPSLPSHEPPVATQQAHVRGLPSTRERAITAPVPARNQLLRWDAMVGAVVGVGGPAPTDPFEMNTPGPAPHSQWLPALHGPTHTSPHGHLLTLIAGHAAGPRHPLGRDTHLLVPAPLSPFNGQRPAANSLQLGRCKQLIPRD